MTITHAASHQAYGCMLCATSTSPLSSMTLSSAVPIMPMLPPINCPERTLPSHWRLESQPLLQDNHHLGLCLAHGGSSHTWIHRTCTQMLLAPTSQVHGACATCLAKAHLWHHYPAHTWPQSHTCLGCSWLPTCPRSHWHPLVLCSSCWPHIIDCPWHTCHTTSPRHASHPGGPHSAPQLLCHPPWCQHPLSGQWHGLVGTQQCLLLVCPQRSVTCC